MGPIPDNTPLPVPESSQLIQNKDDSPFQTTVEVTRAGEVFVAFGKTLFEALIKTRSGSDSYPACEFVGSALLLSKRGKENFHQAWISLPKIRILSWTRQILEFGFNIEGPISHLIKSEQGLSFAALTASLTSIYHTSIVAEIYVHLLELIAEKHSDNEQVRRMQIPTQRILEEPVDCFAGIFSTSSFPNLAEQFMSLDGRPELTTNARARKGRVRSRNARGIGHPQCVAEALFHVLELSRRSSTIKHVSLVGGADAAAIAVVAHWLADLTVVVGRYNESGKFNKIASLPQVPDRNSESQQTDSTAQNGKPDITVVLTDRMGDEFSVSVDSRVVKIYEIIDIVKTPERFFGTLVMSGRVPWSQVFYLTFRDRFNSLGSCYANIGEAFGSAASVYEYLAEGDHDVPTEWLLESQCFYTAAFGQDLISFALDKFPELRILGQERLIEGISNSRHQYDAQQLEFRNFDAQSHVESIMRTSAESESFFKAMESLEKAFLDIAMQCQCNICCVGNENFGPKSLADSRIRYCLVVMVSTIIRFARLMSGIIIDSQNLNIVRSGLQWLYDRQKKRQENLKRIVKEKTRTKHKQVYKYASWILDSMDFEKGYSDYSPLFVVWTLFTGCGKHSDFEPSTSAYADGGICVYYDMLHEPSREAAKCSRIHVIPGHIQANIKSTDPNSSMKYSSIIDIGPDPYASSRDSWHIRNLPVSRINSWARSLADQYDSSQNLDIILRERLSVSSASGYSGRYPLELGFRLSLTGELAIQDWIGPARAMENFRFGSGLFQCRCLGSATVSVSNEAGSSSVSQSNVDAVSEVLNQALPSRSPLGPYKDLKINGVDVTVFRGDLYPALIAAYYSCVPIVLSKGRHKPCLDCAIRQGIRNSWKNFAVICSEESSQLVLNSTPMDL